MEKTRGRSKCKGSREKEPPDVQGAIKQGVWNGVEGEGRLKDRWES